MSTFSLHRYGLNDAGELALLVQLTGGRRLLVRAEPTELPNDRCIIEVPEPGALAAAIVALISLWGLGRRASRRSEPARRAP